VELSDFVAQSLIEIVKGVHAAQVEVQKLGGFINPAAYVRSESGSHFGFLPGNQQQVFLTSFDVAVTATQSTGTNADARLQIASLLKLGAGGNSAESQQTISRLKFEVPIAYPLDVKSKQLMDEANRQTHSSYRRED
jgi:hypothetical protein